MHGRGGLLRGAGWGTERVGRTLGVGTARVLDERANAGLLLGLHEGKGEGGVGEW